MSPRPTTLLGLGESWNGGVGIQGQRGSASQLRLDSSPEDAGTLAGQSGPPQLWPRPKSYHGRFSAGNGAWVWG